MPFRASFYEHFGYGLAELRHEWTVPLSIFPTGDFAGFRFAEQSDFSGKNVSGESCSSHVENTATQAVSHRHRHRDRYVHGQNAT